MIDKSIMAPNPPPHTPENGREAENRWPVPCPAEKQRGHKPLSEVFKEFPEYAVDGYIYLGDIYAKLAGRGRALIFVVLGIPATLIPVLSVGFGIAIFVLSLQMALGRRPFLARILRERKISLAVYEKFLPKLVKTAERAQKLMHPRIPDMFVPDWKLRAYAAIIALMALLLSLPLPIPFTNIPAGIPILLIGLALLERDGLMMILGLILSFVATVLFGLLFWGISVMGVKGVNKIIVNVIPHF